MWVLVEGGIVGCGAGLLVSEQSVLLIVGLAHDGIVVVDKEDHRFVCGSLLGRHVGIGHDDDLVANADTLGCSAIEAYDA